MKAIVSLSATCLLLALFGCKQSANYDPEPDVPDSVMIKTKQELPLLAKPDPKAERLKTVPAGAELMADDVSGLFVRVAFENQTGWLETSFLMFREDGRAFLERKATRHSYSERRNRMGRSSSSSGVLRQCAHVEPSTGKRCLYQTADDSGNCPEHQ